MKEISSDMLPDNKQNDAVLWIKRNIKMRKCSYFMLSDKKPDKDFCQCGHPRNDHEAQEVNRPSKKVKWDFQKHTSAVPTNAFDEIKFEGFRGNSKKFVRVDVKTNMDTMLKLLLREWGLSKPNLLISVTGGADNCNIKPYLRDVFQRDLKKAAKTTGAWIITGGCYSGVMKYVGKAVQDCGMTSANQKSVVVIGVAPWGIIQNRHHLENNEGHSPAKYCIEDEQIPKESFLDPNHTHFILVDDGTQHNHQTEISFRAALERRISEEETVTRDGQIRLESVVSAVPTVILVLEGGPSALQTVRNALDENTPAVIIKGSGRAADILAHAFECAESFPVAGEEKQGEYNKIIKKRMSDDLKEEIREQMKNIGFCQKSRFDDNIAQIQGCLDKAYLIHIFKWNSASGARDMEVAMLKALLKANTKSAMDVLGLALAWNTIDIAKNEIFADCKSWPSGSLDNIMLLAILENRVNFVELFLDNGVILGEFLTIDRLLLLYKQITLKDVEQRIQDLLGDSYYISKENDATNKCQPDTFRRQKGRRTRKYIESDYQNPERELFVWSVLQNYQEMAELFWRDGKDPIAAALVASALFSAMSHRTDDTELIEQLTANAKKFTNLAIGVVKESHSNNEKKTQDLLIRKVAEWGGKSCIEIAINTENKQFISQRECQKLFTCIWKGKMTQETGSLKKKQKPKELTPESKTKLETKDESGDETKKDVKRLCIVKKFSSFYRAPVFVFWHTMISYMIFLCLYSYILICKLEEKVSVEEMILIVWVFTIFTEEIRQACTRASGTTKAKLLSYIKDGWNQIDIITILLFVVGMIWRVIPNAPQRLEVARVFLGVNLVTFFIRLLHIFCVHKELGPKLVMIIKTVQSLISFFVILMVFTVAYAIASHAILYPNAELSLDTLKAIFRRPYWNIYGELMLDEVEGAVGCTNDTELYRSGTYPRCPTTSGKYFVPLLMGLYMLLCNILLLNLLIIMFGDTYEKVQDNIDMYWNLQLLSLTDEYHSRPVLPPPFILIAHVYQLITLIKEKIKNSEYSAPRQSTFSKDFGEAKEEDEKLRKWEDNIFDKLHYKRDPEDQYCMSSGVLSTDLQVNQLVKKMDYLQKQQQSLTVTIEDVQSSLRQIGLTNLRLEKQSPDNMVDCF